jgi:hypothetical protein
VPFRTDVLECFFIWKCVAPIYDLIVPNGCSTVWRRRRILAGFRSSRACTASRTASCSQREIRRSRQRRSPGEVVPEAKITRLNEKIATLRQEIQRLNVLNTQMMQTEDKHVNQHRSGTPAT